MTETQDISKVLLEYYENNPHTADFVFRIKCGDDWISFPIHKLIFCIWSPVFADMFYGENSPLQATSFDIDNVSPTAFGVMNKFMYGDTYELFSLRKDITFLLKTFKLANDYQVEALKISCRDVFLTIKPNETNVFQLLDASDLMVGFLMKTKCIYLLETRTAAVLAANELSDLTPTNIQIILDLKKVSFSSEYELVNWIFAWAKNVSVDNNRSMRSLLEPFLPALDFLALKAEEFEDLLENHTDIIKDSEGYNILRNIVKYGGCPLPEWVSINITRKYSYRG